MILLELNNKLRQQSNTNKNQHDFIERLFNDIQEKRAANNTNTRTDYRTNEESSTQS